MSASILDSFGCDYESYLKTERVEGQKRFGDLKEGDFLYQLKFISYSEGFKWSKLTVTKGWHQAKGHMFIFCKDGDEVMKINFGPSNTANVFDFAPEASIVWYNGSVIGTSMECVFNTMKETYSDLLEEKRKSYETVLNKVKLLDERYEDIF